MEEVKNHCTIWSSQQTNSILRNEKLFFEAINKFCILAPKQRSVAFKQIHNNLVKVMSIAPILDSFETLSSTKNVILEYLFELPQKWTKYDDREFVMCHGGTFYEVKRGGGSWLKSSFRHTNTIVSVQKVMIIKQNIIGFFRNGKPFLFGSWIGCARLRSHDNCFKEFWIDKKLQLESNTYYVTRQPVLFSKIKIVDFAVRFHYIIKNTDNGTSLFPTLEVTLDIREFKPRSTWIRCCSKITYSFPVFV
jgi:hypothetical protein